MRELLVGSIEGGEKRRRGLHGTAGAAAALGHGGGSPVRQGGDGRAREHLRGERIPFPGSIGAGEGRKWELDVEAAGGGAMDATASSLAQGKARLGSGERERSGEGVKHVCYTAKGEEMAEGAGRWR